MTDLGGYATLEIHHLVGVVLDEGGWMGGFFLLSYLKMRGFVE
jgi:hypothetical protein